MSAPGTSQPPVPVPSGDGGGDRVRLGRELSHPPRDGVSNLCFSRHSNRLLVSSWDKSVRFFDVEANQMIAVFSHKRPVLDCCFHDDQSGFSACSDRVVRRLSLDSKKSFRLGIHDAPVSCVEYSCVAGQVISGGWDNTIKCWDPKSGPGQALVGTHNQPERVYSLSIEGYKLVVATAGRHVNVYDLRNMSEPEQQRESPLQHQTRCVECYPNGTGFALGCVEGKIAMEFFDQSESALSKSYVFKCHRLTEGGRRVAYPVNTSTFHPVFGTFATGGCDGFVNVWDGSCKRRLIQYPRYPTSIAALSFNRDGSLLAVASSYTYEMGERPHEPDTIFIRDVNDVEIRPRPRANTIPALPQ